MPYTFWIDKNDGVIRETWRGICDFGQLVQSCQEEWSHPDYHRGLCILSDFRKARARLSVDEVLRFASWFSNEEAPPRHAIVVRRELGLDFAAMFSMLRDSVPASECRTRLFFSYVEADAWVTNSTLVPMNATSEMSGSARIHAIDG